ncbi:DUF2075 domain-containing protein [Methanoregula sp. PtaB.Bin085]|uniref:DUF2075 domain-containing protein n=1 Tax=Methanoregula sp. PtaB.Bin085 TaxID=1811680 RepID=UPI0025D38132|nr:DUF2075 domain-containing protein [Methanoregula sp. PtaB.Bin085]
MENDFFEFFILRSTGLRPSPRGLPWNFNPNLYRSAQATYSSSRVVSLMDEKKPCGWSGAIHNFLSLSKPHWLIAMQEHHKRCMNTPADESQILAWDYSFEILQRELKQLVQIKPAIASYAIIFEYELPRERGRRPDVVILGPCVFVLEFKDYAKLLAAHSDQVAAYARDLKNYHAGSQQYTVLPILVLARAKDLIQRDEDVLVISQDHLADVFDVEVELENGPLIDPQKWITAEYAPLPSLIQAARTIWEKQPLPQIKRAQSAGIPETIAELIRIAKEAQEKNELHLALVTGVPGAGKTLVGIQLVYENHLETFAPSPVCFPSSPLALSQPIAPSAIADSGTLAYGKKKREKNPASRNIAVFLSGNGPLVKVLQHALKNNIFVQDVHGFLKEYGGTTAKIPHEHIWVYDEAQRAWDAERVSEKRGHATSEPEDFLKLAERMNSWALMVALIGEGQEIHLGEESGLPQWNDALAKMQKPWVVHCPTKIAGNFPVVKNCLTTDVLDLSVTLRSHLAEDVAQWIAAILSGDLTQAKMLAERVTSQGFDAYITQDINVAVNYVKERYQGQEEKRYGLLASSKAKNLPAWGINNSFNCTQNIRVGNWYNDPPNSFTSCCSLREVVTEFGCQGMELDFPIVCWGNDFVWDGMWKSPAAKRSKAKDPHRLRMNSYRVLLTRGRDGFIIFIPKEIGMASTYAALVGAGVREVHCGQHTANLEKGLFKI